MMAFNSIGVLDLTNSESAKSWLLAFGALARAKGWTDTDAFAETDDLPAHYCITDNFLASCGLSALDKLRFIVAPKHIQDMKFKDIMTSLEAYLKPKKRLTIAEQTNTFP